MTVNVSNKTCRALVQSRTAFQGSNLYGKTLKNDVYVVYSYGPHFPLFAYIKGKWYGHKEKASVSTSRQTSQCHPWVDVEYLEDASALKRLIETAAQ